ncbi:MAG: hypothetical protein ORN49_08975, partial [Rhodobacteraceae bacterium]|nr:hypothetical protein [Paracoccaceae bacterium]
RSADSMPDIERHQRVSYLPQDPRLFAGSVRENILLDFTTPGVAPEATAFVDRITRVADLDNDLAGFPQGMDTAVGEGGVKGASPKGWRNIR